ncbi:MAG: CDP-diacylglycerol--serine O-phosphatidyltransferase [Gammaproteobacteria bacterium]|nr:CDP-diacylglycerol--serine O-phosphatidyltransferase [Gammaproteobacteria bacterium]
MTNKTNKKPHRGIYLLPNLFTTAALFCGFYAIISSINGKFETAAIAIFVAMVLDGIDGRVARLTNTESDFGAEFDSLADMVSFGLAPALIIYLWSLSNLGKIGWLVSFIYVACAALRLARFNTQASHSDKRYFQGLASPAAAAVVAGLIWNGDLIKEFITLPTLQYLALATTLFAGLLMVSNVRYHSFKGVNWRSKVPFFTILMFVFALVFVSAEPALVLFAIFLVYALSGPVLTVIMLRRHRAERALLKHQDKVD